MASLGIAMGWAIDSAMKSVACALFDPAGPQRAVQMVEPWTVNPMGIGLRLRAPVCDS